MVVRHYLRQTRRKEVRMSASLNKVMLIGNLGRDPETRTTDGGQTVCTFSVATTDQWTDRDGQKQERTEWHRIVIWGRQAETAAKYLRKGRSVYLEGRLQTREYQDKENNKKRTTEIVVDRFQFLGGQGGGQGGGAAPPPPGDADAPSWA
jgi:single-strand DNA-binding protein